MLNSIAKISLYTDSLPGLQISRGASLVVIADTIGDSEVGFQWVAKTEDEDRHLVQFAQTLIEEISSRKPNGRN